MAKGDQLKMKCCENCTFVHPFSMRIGRRQVLGGGVNGDDQITVWWAPGLMGRGGR